MRFHLLCTSITAGQWTRRKISEFIRAVYRAMRGKEQFGMQDVLELLEKNPGLEKMNSEIVSNRGYYKSLFKKRTQWPRRATPSPSRMAWL